MRDDPRVKISFEGTVLSVQVRSDVWRYKLDNRTHRCTGYNVFLAGTADGKERTFSVALSEKQQERCRLRIGDTLRGTAWTKLYPEREYADFYRAGALRVTSRGPGLPEGAASPWTGEVEPLATYAERGCRMLDKRRYKAKCFACKWAAMANVTIEYNFGVTQRHRYESFCYGPKSCPLYTMGRPRAVPYKDMGSLYDEGWLDDMLTEQRDWDD